MKLHRSLSPISSSLLFLLVTVFLACPLMAAQYEEDVSAENYQYAKGIVNSVSLDEQTVAIKQKKGPTIVLSIDKDTLFEGFYRLEELKPRDTIKFWYQPGPKGNRALKLLKPLELGC